MVLRRITVYKFNHGGQRFPLTFCVDSDILPMRKEAGNLTAFAGCPDMPGAD